MRLAKGQPRLHDEWRRTVKLRRAEEVRLALSYTAMSDPSHTVTLPDANDESRLRADEENLTADSMPLQICSRRDFYSQLGQGSSPFASPTCSSGSAVPFSQINSGQYPENLVQTLSAVALSKIVCARRVDP